jgi:hypothetical protein
MFTHEISPLSTQTSTEVTNHFLRYLHEPTPPDIKTYKNLVKYYWSIVIMKYGFGRGADVVTLVIDKPEFMPDIIIVIHKERKQKSKGEIIINHKSCHNT